MDQNAAISSATEAAARESKASDRERLTSRTLPQMTLSDGSESSMTAPLPPMAAGMSAEERARERFAVRGNAVITGGLGTLALACARALLEHGLASLTLLDHPSSMSTSSSPAIPTASPAVAALAALRASFPNTSITLLPADVTSGADVQNAIQSVINSHGTVDTLCCFAGIVDCVPAVDLPSTRFNRVLDVNTTGAFNCAQAVARAMIPLKRRVSIIFISSISAHRTNFPQPQPSYNASKAALSSLARSLAAEWAVHGIRVNAVLPGYMDTILNAGDGLRDARREWVARNPSGRMGVAEELEGVVVLLASGRAGSYVTGAEFVVDGGGSVF